MTWTRFMDMYSGGDQKEKWSHIYIQAPEDEACVIFYNRFGHNPHRVTCTCCGPDYSIGESDTLEAATYYERGAKWDGEKFTDELDPYVFGRNFDGRDKALSVAELLELPDYLVIYEHEILPAEREGSVPPQGYVWID